MSHHYAFVAAKLVEQCLEQIQGVIDTDERSKRLHPSNSSLYDMKEALAEAERQLFYYFVYIIQKEVENSSSAQVHEIYEKDYPCYDLASSVDFLHLVLREFSLSAVEHAGHPTHSYYPRRSATDSLLFRLNVALQLCLVRIDDARLVICGRRHTEGPIVDMAKLTTTRVFRPWPARMAAGLLGVTTLSLLFVKRHPEFKVLRNVQVYQPLLRNAAMTGVALFATQWLHQKWSNMWMTNKIVKSTEEIEEWSRQWTLVQCIPTPKTPQQLNKKAPSPSPLTETNQDTLLDAARSQRLIEYALHETTKVSDCIVHV